MTTERAVEVRMANAADISAIKERFMDKVEVTSPWGCWNWQRPLHKGGYGRFHMFGETYAAHRASFILFVNDGMPIADMEMLVLHSCDNKVCVNPRHLRLGTHADNMKDAVTRGRMRAPNKILTDEQVFEIRARYRGRDGEQKALAEEFGVGNTTIANIVNGLARQKLIPLQPLPLPIEGDLFERKGTLSEKRPQGASHHKAKLTKEEVRAMRAESAAGARGVDLAKKYGIQKAQVSAILSGRYWKNA